MECEKCINLCIDKNDTSRKVQSLYKDQAKARIGTSADNFRKSERFTVVPNPTTKDWIINITDARSSSPGTIKLQTIDGKVVFRQAIDVNKGSNLISVPGSNLPAGYYILEISQNDEISRLKLLKE